MTFVRPEGFDAPRVTAWVEVGGRGRHLACVGDYASKHGEGRHFLSAIADEPDITTVDGRLHAFEVE